MSLIDKVKKKLAEFKVPYELVELSDKPNKKIKIVINGKVIHFGDKNSLTFLEGADDKKRKAYQARASKITNKDGEYTYKIRYTPNFLSFNILW